MTCKACYFVHPPMQSCGTAKRLREAGTQAVVQESPKVVPEAVGRPKFDRTAYQREYMRVWRLKAK